MHSSLALAVAALATSAHATNYLGFSSGSKMYDDSAKFKADFKAEFEAAQNLIGAPGTFNAVRLYTNIQAYSTKTPIEAFEAAIETKTHMLLGIWTSGTTTIQNELDALLSAVSSYGTDFTDLVIGMSIGSEDLYRNSVTGVENDSGVGADPSVITDFIKKYKAAVSGTGLSSVPVGHVDTWDAWTNSTNKAVIDAVDWLGVDEYPYYQGTVNNSIAHAGTLFDEAYDATVSAAGGKPVWVTETGWPYTGKNWEEAVPSVENAKTYWDEVGCRRLFGKTTTFWYILRDSDSAQTMKFSITDDLSTTPRFNLTCPTTFATDSSSTSSSASSSSATSSSATLSSAGSSSATSTDTAKKSDTTGTASTETGMATGSATSTAMATGAATASASKSTATSASHTTASKASSTSSGANASGLVTSGASSIRLSLGSLAVVFGVVALL